MKTYTREELINMATERTFKRPLSSKYLFFRLLDFNPEVKTFTSIEYKDQEYFALNCIFVKGEKINQSVNGQILLTFKGLNALLKEYEKVSLCKEEPLFYGRYNRYKNVEINHISKWDNKIIE